VASPIALVSILLEASIGPMSNKGRITGRGNLEERGRRAKLLANLSLWAKELCWSLRACSFV